MDSKLKQKFKQWQAGESGFYQWLNDIKPRILTKNNKYEVFQPTTKQEKLISEILKRNKAGRFRKSMFLNIEPRRHGKSTIFALLTLWFFTTRRYFTIQLLGANEDHCRRTQYRVLLGIINNTPKLAGMIPTEMQFTYETRFPQLSNKIQYFANNLSSSFGDKINLLWVSDLHAFEILGTFNALQASVLDSEDSLIFIDSNVDCTDGPVHGLQQQTKIDNSIFCNFTSYKDLKQYNRNAPLWIDRKKAARLQATTLPADFARDILGQRVDAKNALFPAEYIKQCEGSYQTPVADISAITKGRAYKIGGGLDRAKSLVAIGRGDHTVWTTVLKVAVPGSEPEFYVLNQHKFKVNSDQAIKKVIQADHERYGLNNVVLENYEVSSIFAWLQNQKVPAEMIHPSENVQNAAFPAMHRLFAEGRFHFPADLADFKSELSSFAYTQRKNGLHSFGHATARQHDDTVYSACWAIFSLRSEVLTAYTLDNIYCHNKSPKRRYCFLMGGDLVLNCARDCEAAQKVQAMYEEFKGLYVDQEVDLPGFFNNYVQITGARMQQAI